MAHEVEFIRRSEVLRITGLRKSTLYSLMKSADDPFPQNYPTSQRGRAWIRAEVLQWCERRRDAARIPTPIEEAMRLRREAE
jgi:predicted DNA-binding transcriptional regulator AlpA